MQVPFCSYQFLSHSNAFLFPLRIDDQERIQDFKRGRSEELLITKMSCIPMHAPNDFSSL